jgi:hypothetical protein
LRINTWLNGHYQAGINALANEDFAGRESLIRWYNEIVYRLFRTSYMSNGHIIVGKHENLYEEDYLLSYGQFISALSRENVESLVAKMKRLSERLKEFGSCFVFVITPNKATIFPEDVPNRYSAPTKDGRAKGSNYATFIPILQRYQVAYVDGREITLAEKGNLPVPVFPRTGTHWTRAVALFSVNELLEVIRKETGRDLPEVVMSNHSVNHIPDDVDSDLFNLLNLNSDPGRGNRFLHALYRANPRTWRPSGTISIVGGSFVHQIAEILDQAAVFRRIAYFRYFKTERIEYPGFHTSLVDPNTIAWDGDFFQARAVVLEANEEAMNSPHLPEFLDAALSALDRKGVHHEGH